MKFFFHLVFFHIILIHLFSQNIDINLLRKLNLNRNAKFDNSFRFITNTKSFVTLGVISGLASYSILKKDSVVCHKTLFIASSVLIAVCISNGLKYIVNRPRPYIDYPEIQKLSVGGSPSFPSGHTSEAFSVATALSIKYPRWYIIAPAFIWASAVGYSRLHLGVHYPSDVLAGAFIGSSSVLLNKWINNKILYKKKYVKVVN